MLVVLLPSALTRHLEFAVGQRERLRIANTWSEFERILQAYPESIAFVDPSLDEVASMAVFARMSAKRSALPIVAYMPISAIAFHVVCELSRSGLEHCMLYSHDDSVDEIFAKISNLRSNLIAERFISRLRPSLVSLPVPIQFAVQTLFSQPHKFHNAQDLAISAGVSTAALYRAFRTARFSAPKKMVVAARLLRMYAQLKNPRQSVCGAAAKLSYRSVEVLACHTREVFGVCPSRLRDVLTEPAVFGTLLCWLGQPWPHGTPTLRSKNDRRNRTHRSR